ncbi:MAG: prephenate dehydrogenase/arogenate dehydrogenase family protein, partial [Acidobacteria bacterium]|nr:prephenate dehydrogenase/arogenate dehydrogenase family protein [Acidobacteriota bacterium]
MSTPTRRRRALLLGVGLIGGSIGLALKERGWEVLGRDASSATLDAALDLGVIDAVAPPGPIDAIDITFVATPVGAIAEGVRLALADTTGVVTDVGSVKTPLLDILDDPR